MSDIYIHDDDEYDIDVSNLFQMMTMMISLLMKLQQEEESGLLVKSCLIPLESRDTGAAPGS